MVSIQDETADAIKDFAQKADVDVDKVQEVFKLKYKETEEEHPDWSDDRLESFALRRARTRINVNSRTPSQEVELLVVGGEVRNGENGDYFNGTALVDLDPEEDTGASKLGQIIVNDDDLIPDIYRAFDEVGNVVKGEFSVKDGDLENHVSLFSVDETEVEVARPDDREPLYEELRSVVPEVTIENIADNLSSQVRNDDGDVYTVTSDIRRIEGDIYDGYKDQNEGNGTYTVRDQTVFDEEDIVDSDVYNADTANENAVPGLTCWIDPAKMEYGAESVCEFYGTLTQNDDGEVMMNVHGVTPILETEFDGYEVTEDQAPGEEQVESSVDRTQI